MHVGICDLDHVKVILGHSVRFAKNWVITQKRIIILMKRTKIWVSEVCAACMLVFLTLNMSRSFKVIRCTLPKIWGVTQQRLIIERNGPKTWPSGTYITMHVDIFDLEHVRVIWGHLVHFSEKGS